jgi:fluoride exporter
VIPLWVALGAALGAPLRYLTDRAVQARFGSAFPWGTLAVNAVGSFVLGFVAALTIAPALSAVVGVGFCGALTTYSTFGYETVRLAEQRRVAAATANLIGSVLAGLAAAALGFLLARLLS